MAEAITLFRGEHNFLSNFAFAEVEYDGVKYRSVEHAYQAAKSFNPTYRLMIHDVNLPSAAKRLGRTCDLRHDWVNLKIGIMRVLLRQKFSIPWLKEKLLATGDAELVEGNNWNDTFWGKCSGVGENHLGRLLMEVREEKRNESIRI